MSKKRASDEQTNAASNSLRQDDNSQPAKRTKCIPPLFSNVKLWDLGNELLKSILLKAVVMEAKGMAKRVWKATADLAISRLGTVCPHWKNVLTTDIFRTTVNRILDSTTQRTVRVERLHQSGYKSSVLRVAALKDEVFMLCMDANQAPHIYVFDRDSILVAPKLDMQLPALVPEDMVTCNVSNCVYVLRKETHCYSVLRFARNETGHFKMSKWLNGLSLAFTKTRLFESMSGNLVILSHQDRPHPTVVRVYNTAGSKQCAITLSPTIYGFWFIFGVIQKSNGNLVLATISDGLDTVLKEIDTAGKVVRQYRSSIYGDSGVCVADDNGRIMIAGRGNTAELLDAEFNLLDLTVPKVFFGGLQIPCGMHYNSERKEVVRLYEMVGINRCRVLIIFRFSEQ